jgi:hypothetical protein
LIKLNPVAGLATLPAEAKTIRHVVVFWAKATPVKRKAKEKSKVLIVRGLY